MRLSEAILLGSTMMTPRRGGGDGVTEGCALNFGNAAMGVRGSWVDSLFTFPWINKEEATPCCGCLLTEHTYSIAGIIAHTFDVHVMGDKTWSLEGLCEWIDSVDPTPRREPPVQEPAQVETRQESTVSHG